MKRVRTAAIAPLVLLGAVCSGCSNGVFSSPQYLAVTISPRPSAVAVGGSVQLTAAVSNNLSRPVWTVLDAGDAANPGTLTAVAGQPNAILYTAPPAPPIYAGVPPTFTQGTVTIEATVTPPAGSASLPDAQDEVSVFITASSVSVGISPATVTVALGQTQFFSGYAVGSVNNALIWEVNGVVGGSAATGYIDTTGLYSAPASMPMTGSVVTVTAVSQADATKTASGIVTSM
jgi:hypothetical protein